MSRNELNAWWATLVVLWGYLWFAVIVTLLASGKNAEGMTVSLPVIVIAIATTGAYVLVWLFRITYLAGRKDRK